MRAAGGAPEYQPKITFEYSYEDQDYISSNMYPGGQKPEDYNVESNPSRMLPAIS